MAVVYRPADVVPVLISQDLESHQTWPHFECFHLSLNTLTHLVRIKADVLFTVYGAGSL